MHPDEQPRNMGDADVLIFGNGPQPGSAAYRFIADQGLKPLGLVPIPNKATAHTEAGPMSFRRCRGQAISGQSCDLGRIKGANPLAMDDLEGQADRRPLPAPAGLYRAHRSHALHESHQDQIREAGAELNTLSDEMNQAGCQPGPNRPVEALQKD